MSRPWDLNSFMYLEYIIAKGKENICDNVFRRLWAIQYAICNYEMSTVVADMFVGGFPLQFRLVKFDWNNEMSARDFNVHILMHIS